jgi:hypothetical protein
MQTNLEQAALLIKFNCCYAELTGKVASKLGKYKLCNLKSELRDMKLARAYIYRIHKYNTLVNDVAFGYLITFERPNSTRITITITINGVDYRLSNTTSDLPTIIEYFTDVLETAGYEIIPYGDNGFIVYSLDSDYEDYITTGVITANPSQTLNTITVTEYSSSIADILLEDTNCLSREEICGIINQTCCILDKYCTN